MLRPRIQRVKRNLVALLRSLTPASGLQYAITVREIDDDEDPQADCEVDVVYTGDEAADEQAIGHSDIWLEFYVYCQVSKRLANEDIPIDEVAMVVDADIWTAIMADPYQGTECLNTQRSNGEAVGNLANGYYGIGRTYRFLVTCDEDQPFSR
jgi:hypothetical protein